MISILIFYIPIGCNYEEVGCSEEEGLNQKFNQYLININQELETYVNKQGVYIAYRKEFVDNYFFLTRISGIKGTAKFSDFVVYTEEQFKKDRKKWEKWYEENKCSISIQQLDSLEQIIQTNNTHLFNAEK